MLEQTFSLSDIPSVATLTFLEIALSADNAIVLGLLASKLQPLVRKKALYIGSVSAIFLRAISLLFVSFMMRHTWIQLMGAGYLIYLCFAHFRRKRREKKISIPFTPSFWKTVLLIEIFDILFAIDSLVASIAFIGHPPPGSGVSPKLWIAYAGGIVGLLAIRYAADLFARLIDRFPRIESSAFLMIGWIGIKLAYTSFPWTLNLEPLFWSVLLLLLALGFVKRRR